MADKGAAAAMQSATGDGPNLTFTHQQSNS